MSARRPRGGRKAQPHVVVAVKPTFVQKAPQRPAIASPCGTYVRIDEVETTGPRGGKRHHFVATCLDCGRTSGPVSHQDHSDRIEARTRLLQHACPTPRTLAPDAQILLDLTTIVVNGEQPSLYFAIAHGVAGSLDDCVRNAWSSCENGFAMAKLAELHNSGLHMPGVPNVHIGSRFSLIRMSDDGLCVYGASIEVDDSDVTIAGSLASVARTLRRLIPPDEVWRLWDPGRRFTTPVDGAP